MINLIQQVLGDKAGPMLDQLQKAGLNGAQAQQFLNASGEQTLDLLKGQAAKADLASLAQPNMLSALLGKIDVNALASKAGIDGGLAAKGLQAILPMLVSALSSKDMLGNIAGLLGQSQGGLKEKIAGGIGKLF